MSTILDALKKVEKEQDPGLDAEKQRQLNALQPASRKNSSGSWRRRIKGVALGAVLCLVSGTGLLWYFRVDETSMQRKMVNTQTRAAPMEKKAPLLPDGDNGAKSVSSESPPSQVPKVVGQQQRTEGKPRPTAENSVPVGPQSYGDYGSIQNRTSSGNGPNNQANLSPGTTTTPAAGAPEKQPAAPQSPFFQNEQPPDPSRSPTHQAPPVGEPSGGTSYGVLDRLADGSLKVQAIAWSPIANERMTVINSKIVREGNSVDDYTIVTIGQNEVVVRKGGQMWRVEFGRP